MTEMPRSRTAANALARHKRNEQKRRRTALYATIIILMMPAILLMQSTWISSHKDLFKQTLHLRLHTQYIPCDHCGGSGTVPVRGHPDQREKCPLCFGIGGHDIRKFGTNEVLCTACGGLGRVMDEKSGYCQTCPRCDGRGLYALEPDRPRRIMTNRWVLIQEDGSELEPMGSGP